MTTDEARGGRADVASEAATGMSLELLPAGNGDALWLECHRDGARPWRMLVDGGPAGAWPALKARIEALPEGERVFDVVVVSHIDHDHIGGLLPLFEATSLGVEIGDVWFNGLPQLPEDEAAPRRSVAEGESLVSLLIAAGGRDAPPWNRVVGGEALVTGAQGSYRELVLTDAARSPRITLLSPTVKRLVALRRTWDKSLLALRRGEPEETDAALPRLPLDDLSALAATATRKDRSAPNGSSIALLVEHRGASCLLAADAFPNVLAGALHSLAEDRGAGAVPVDVFKVSHHGSEKNVRDTLISLLPAARYAISTSGDGHDHPDDVAIARIVTGGPPGLSVDFNYDTPANRRWADPDLMAAYDYRVTFPEHGAGLRIDLPLRADGRP